MASTDSTSPLTPSERASIARLFEATRDHLSDPRLDFDRLRSLTTWLAVGFDRVSLAVRQGYRAAVIDRVTADLDAYVAQLVDG